VGRLTVDTQSLKQWAIHHGDGMVEDHPDSSLSLTSKLLRFRWNGAPTVGVGSDADGKVRINAVLDGVSWFLANAEPADDPLHLLVGLPALARATESPLKEHLDAIGTLVTELRDGPTVRVWLLAPGSDPTEKAAKPANFTTTTPQRWTAMLMAAAVAPVSGLAAALMDAVDHPSFALYPKLSSQTASEPWQMRLDGLEIGRVSAATATLRLASRDLRAPREPRSTWREVVGEEPRSFDTTSLVSAVALIKQLIAAWTDNDRPDAVLRHGQPEHALEAHVLSGRLPLATTSENLCLAVPYDTGALRAAQFPTLWGDVTRPARYLDALLADADWRPWAIELKDQDAGGGHGAYLRHGIGQAVLYRHYIRCTSDLDPWFHHHRLDRVRCEAALAFPTGAAAAAKTVAAHRDLARRYGVHVIEFPRPGTLAP
jgi:hypothetical protein